MKPSNVSTELEISNDQSAIIDYLSESYNYDDTVKINWKLTYQTRMDMLDHISVFDYFEKFKLFKQQCGAVLIFDDFLHWYENESLNLYKNWNQFIEKLSILLKDNLKDQTQIGIKIFL